MLDANGKIVLNITLDRDKITHFRMSESYIFDIDLPELQLFVESLKNLKYLDISKNNFVSTKFFDWICELIEKSEDLTVNISGGLLHAELKVYRLRERKKVLQHLIWFSKYDIEDFIECKWPEEIQREVIKIHKKEYDIK